MAHTVTLAYALQRATETDQIDTAFTVVDTDSKIHLVAQADAVAGTPTAAQIIAGQDADSNPAPAAADTGGLLQPGALGGIALNGLAPGTYDVFAVATDGADANEGAVDSVTGVVLALPAPPYGGPDDAFPDNVNAAPPGPTSGWTADAPVYAYDWADPDEWAFGTLSINFETGVVSYGGTKQSEGHIFYLGIYPVGSKPPTGTELVAGTGADQNGSDTGAAGVASSVTLPAASDLTKSYDIYCAMSAAGAGASDVYYLGTLDTLTANDAPYDGSLPAGFAWKDPNSAIAITPATLVTQVV